MGYNDHNSNDIFVKVRGAIDEDDEGEEQALAAQDLQAQAPPTQDPGALSLAQVMEVLG